ncbi:MAG: caspase domain-containing protein [Henriciella sp.]
MFKRMVFAFVAMIFGNLQAWADQVCEFGGLQHSDDGQMRIALLIGIDDYEFVRDLNGAVNDVRRMSRYLEKSAGFPKSNICTVVNSEATYDGVKKAFAELASAASDEEGVPADQVLIFYAGHGSRLPDDNNDEPDLFDETLVLHDSVAPRPNETRVPQLRDDEFNALLSRVYDRSPNLTVILDSCHSGTGTRAFAASRFVSTLEFDTRGGESSTDRSDGGLGFADYQPEDFPNAVFLSAASDHQEALEVDGSGVFTSAILHTLREQRGLRVTYDQLFSQIVSRMRSTYYQNPTLSGNARKYVFNDGTAFQPTFEWVVEAVEANDITVQGFPVPGAGAGAIYEILPGSADATEVDAADVGFPKFVALEYVRGDALRLVPYEDDTASSVSVGDYARIVQSSPDSIKMYVSVAPPGRLVSTNVLESLDEDQLNLAFPDGEKKSIKLIEGLGDLTLRQLNDDWVEIVDQNGIVRNKLTINDSEIAKRISFRLRDHLAQKVLLAGWDTSDSAMIVNHSLRVEAEPFSAPNRGICKVEYEPKPWEQAGANTLQEIPVCQAYKLKVKLSNGATVPVQIAGSVLSADGSKSPIPRTSSGQNSSVTLAPGQEATIGVFQAPPEAIGVTDHVFVLGLPLGRNVPWHLLKDPSRQFDISARVGLLEDKEPGTYSVLALKTVANSEFDSEEPSDAPLSREYTISKFDVSPYLPDAGPASALYRLLKVADGLANRDEGLLSSDGVPYKQHGWCEGSEIANLEQGIDCSRAIWFAFTRAGLPYNRYSSSIPDEAVCSVPYDPSVDGYLYTGDMARPDYLMSDNFVSCMSDDVATSDLRIGDVLVYRDPVRGDGHTVMVIDPARRIAWGSHGWDGEPRLIERATGVRPDPDLGVEYQKIKVKSDWRKWDRSTMELRACWRHRTLIEEAKSPTNQPGMAQICRNTLKTDHPYYSTSLCRKILETVGDEGDAG